jgi:phosphatidyl-myo-inositol dimannoside synthase
MPRTLVVTNDFPPRPGGIQSYLHALASRMPAHELVVYAPSWHAKAGSHPEFDADQEFDIIRHPGTLMLPTPRVAKRAREILRAEGCTSVWFGAAAPLALLAPGLRDAGAERIVASTHGHEVGWSMLPGTRQALRRIGTTCDVVTFVSRYTRSRFASAFGPMAALEHLPSGVDTTQFRPDPMARKDIRERYGLGDRPIVVCVSRLWPRKGQDMLIRALPEIRRRVPDTVLLLVGGGPYQARLQAMAEQLDVAEHVVMTGRVPWDELPAHFVAGDVFAMPCRTHGRGLDVEGLGIVYLEASASGLPVVAGNSGGAPEAVLPGETGHVIDGRQQEPLVDTITTLLTDPDRATTMGEAGRRWVSDHWRWDRIATRLADLLHGRPPRPL